MYRPEGLRKYSRYTCTYFKKHTYQLNENVSKGGFIRPVRVRISEYTDTEMQYVIMIDQFRYTLNWGGYFRKVIYRVSLPFLSTICKLTGIGKRRGGIHTYVSVPGRLKLIIYTEMSAYLNAALPTYRLLGAAISSNSLFSK